MNYETALHIMNKLSMHELKEIKHEYYQYLSDDVKRALKRTLKAKQHKNSTITVSISILLFVILFIYAWYFSLTRNSSGYYEPTSIMQEDGTYYRWVDD